MNLWFNWISNTRSRIRMLSRQNNKHYDRMRTIKSAFTHKMRVEREGIEERKKIIQMLAALQLLVFELPHIISHKKKLVIDFGFCLIRSHYYDNGFSNSIYIIFPFGCLFWLRSIMFNFKFQVRIFFITSFFFISSISNCILIK